MKRLIVCLSLYCLAVCGSQAGQEPLTLEGHSSRPSRPISVDFSPDGKRIVSGNAEHVDGQLQGSVKVWDAETGQKLLTLGHTGELWIADFSPDGKRILSESGKKTVKVWDAETGQELFTLQGITNEALTPAFSSDGKRIVGGSHSESEKDAGTVKVWDANTGHELLTLEVYTDYSASVAYSPDGKRIFAYSRGDRVDGQFQGTVKVWDADTGQELRTLTLKGIISLRELYHVLTRAFSPDGKRIVGDNASTVKVWDTETGQELLTLQGHTDYVSDVAFSPDGKRIVSRSGDKTVKVWDAETGQELGTLKGRYSLGIVTGVIFSPDGQRIAMGDGNTVRVLDLSSLDESRRQAEAVVQAAWLDLSSQEEFTKDSVSKQIRANQTITEVVRQKALQLLEIWNDPTAKTLNNQSWGTVRMPDSTATEYEKALRQVQVAVALEPDDGFYLNTLGVAHYRVGNYQAALTTLTRSEQLNSRALDGSLPSDLVFLAMANQQLGNTDEAREQLQQLRLLIREQGWSEDAELQAWLQEAEALIESDPPPETEAAHRTPADGQNTAPPAAK